MPRNQFLPVLRTLVEREVAFVLVGGVAGIVHGAPISTYDVDIVHSRTDENVARLLVALEALDAYYRIQPERRLRPGASHLSSPGHQLLMTRFGALDVLGQIGEGRSFENLLPHASEMQITDTLRVRVLDLETLIAVKEEVGAEKDAAMLPILRRTLEESRRRPV
jgi:predicted nucleotidyltransferase